MKASEGEMAEGVDYCGLVKMSHKVFCIDTLEKLMKDWPGGHIFLLRVLQ